MRSVNYWPFCLGIEMSKKLHNTELHQNVSIMQRSHGHVPPNRQMCNNQNGMDTFPEN